MTLPQLAPATPQRPKSRWRTHCRKRIRRTLKTLLSILLVILIIFWWKVLRIVEQDHWPLPPDAVTSAQAQGITEKFARKDDPQRDDVGIPYAPSTASDVQLVIGGDAFFPAILTDIESARQSIHMLMFGFVPGEWGDRYADALITQAERGVEVRISVDRYGSKTNGISEGMFDQMAAAGVEIVVNDIFPLQAKGLLPDRTRTWRQDEIGQADHRKMLVIDGKIGWMGGAGIQDHFASAGGNTFHDQFVRVEGDIVRQMQAVFLTSFRSYGGNLSGEPGSLEAYFPTPANAGTIRVTLLQNIPGGFLPGTEASRDLIEHATGTLDIMNPYFTDPGMLDRIVNASKRGVRVRMLVSEQSNNGPADAALKHQYGRLKDAGVEIWEYPATMHAKVTVADDTAIIGTINYDAWALYRNLEIALLFEDASVANDIRSTYIEPDIASSRPGEAPDGFVDQSKGWFWDKLTYFL